MPWKHRAMCRACWQVYNGERQPVRVLGSPQEECAICDAPTTDGIYVRTLEGCEDVDEAIKELTDLLPASRCNHSAQDWYIDKKTGLQGCHECDEKPPASPEGGGS